MNKQPERTAKTKQALIDSFWGLYTEKRIEKITIKEITANAGYYRSTFYEYFGSVYDVLEEVENNLINEFKSMIPRLLSSKNIDEAFSIISSLYEKNGIYVVVLFGQNGDSTFTAKARELLKATIAKYLDLPEDDMQLELTVMIIYSCVFSILNYWYTHKDTVSLQEVMTLGRSILQNGLAPHLHKLGLTFMAE